MAIFAAKSEVVDAVVKRFGPLPLPSADIFRVMTAVGEQIDRRRNTSPKSHQQCDNARRPFSFERVAYAAKSFDS